MKSYDELLHSIEELPAFMSEEEALGHPAVIAVYHERAKEIVSKMATIPPANLMAVMQSMVASTDVIHTVRKANQDDRTIWAAEGVLFLATVGLADVLKARIATTN